MAAPARRITATHVLVRGGEDAASVDDAEPREDRGKAHRQVADDVEHREDAQTGRQVVTYPPAPPVCDKLAT
jgi:hypothetical protein